MSKLLLEPLAYPFDIPRRGYSLTRGNLTWSADELAGSKLDFDSLVRLAGGRSHDLLIESPVGLFTCGSNASPTRLSEKLDDARLPQAFAVRFSVQGWMPVYAATLSHYGAIPATFEWVPTASAEPFLVVIDRVDLRAIVKTERRSRNYDMYKVTPQSLGIHADFPVFAFVAKEGALRLQGDYVPLDEFQPLPVAGQATQEKLLKRVLDELGEVSFTEYLARIDDESFVQEMRRRIIENFGSQPNVPGWELA